ncbi:hypothetical protein SIIN_5156_T [Serendipita indica DSM 11827]|nr:hypothetical protein SIIN_5156_T [Serendipita indica DSM 11827]
MALSMRHYASNLRLDAASDIEVATISRSKWTLPKFLYYYIRFVTAIFMCFEPFN